MASDTTKSVWSKSLPHDGQVQRTEGVRVAVDRPATEDGLDEVLERVPLVEAAQGGAEGRDVVRHGAHAVVGKVEPRVVLGQGEVRELEVGGALASRRVGPRGERVGVVHELGDADGGDEAGDLGRTPVPELLAGTVDALAVGARARIEKGVAREVDEASGVVRVGLHA
jgi:hypothetical protein